MIEELTYLDRMKIRLEGGEDSVPFFLGAKSRVREIAKLMGIRTPAVYYEGALSGLDWDELPQEFVLKPSFASTSIGVFLLVRDGDDFRSAISGESITKNQIIEKCGSVSARFFDGDTTAGSFIVEELLRDRDGSTPPKDVRVNAFFGEIGMVYYDDHLSGSVATASYFDGDFQPFADIEDRYSVAKEVEAYHKVVQQPRPASADVILNVAKRISLAIPCAFIRVDLYDTPEGVYLGEITFTPGAFYYKNVKLMLDKENKRLGRIWGAAHERLKTADVVPSKP